MADYHREVIKELKAAGWKFYRHGKGDHDIWIIPDSRAKVVVDGKIKSRHTANGIMKTIGSKRHF